MATKKTTKTATKPTTKTATKPTTKTASKPTTKTATKPTTKTATKPKEEDYGIKDLTAAISGLSKSNISQQDIASKYGIKIDDAHFQQLANTQRDGKLAEVASQKKQAKNALRFAKDGIEKAGFQKGTAASEEMALRGFGGNQGLAKEASFKVQGEMKGETAKSYADFNKTNSTLAAQEVGINAEAVLNAAQWAQEARVQTAGLTTQENAQADSFNLGKLGNQMSLNDQNISRYGTALDSYNQEAAMKQDASQFSATQTFNNKQLAQEKSLANASLKQDASQFNKTYAQTSSQFKASQAQEKSIAKAQTSTAAKQFNATLDWQKKSFNAAKKK